MNTYNIIKSTHNLELFILYNYNSVLDVCDRRMVPRDVAGGLDDGPKTLL